MGGLELAFAVNAARSTRRRSHRIIAEKITTPATHHPYAQRKQSKLSENNEISTCGDVGMHSGPAGRSSLWVSPCAHSPAPAAIHREQSRQLGGLRSLRSGPYRQRDVFSKPEKTWNFIPLKAKRLEKNWILCRRCKFVVLSGRLLCILWCLCCCRKLRVPLHRALKSTIAGSLPCDL